MSALIAKIHIMANQIGLEGDTYCDALFSIAGKTSCKHMSYSEQVRVVQEFKRRGAKEVPARPLSGTASGKYAPVLRALWISAYNLGIARSRDDKALIAFVKRQTGLDHTQFLTEPGDAKRAIEALKKWMTREAGVEWPGKGSLEAKRAVVVAQWLQLVKLGAVRLLNGADSLDGLAEYIGKAAHNRPRMYGVIDDPRITSGDLDRAQSALGRWIRVVIAKQGKAA